MPRGKGREVKSKWRAATLFEKNEETDEQIDQANQVDVEIAGRPLVNRIQIVRGRRSKTTLGWIRRPLDQVVKVAADARLIEIYLNVSGVIDLLHSCSLSRLIADQAIAGKDLTTRSRRTVARLFRR